MPKCPKCDKEVYFGERVPAAPGLSAVPGPPHGEARPGPGSGHSPAPASAGLVPAAAVAVPGCSSPSAPLGLPHAGSPHLSRLPSGAPWAGTPLGSNAGLRLPLPALSENGRGNWRPGRYPRTPLPCPAPGAHAGEGREEVVSLLPPPRRAPLPRQQGPRPPDRCPTHWSASTAAAASSPTQHWCLAGWARGRGGAPNYPWSTRGAHSRAG